VLIARREDKLQELQALLHAKHPDLRILCVGADLSDNAQREWIFSQLADKNITPNLLVNNAGLGDYGEFASSDWDKVKAMIEVNMTALTHLSHHFISGMQAQGGGHILNVSSLASLLPIPDFAVYAATKAYVTSFGEALRAELREHNISVTTVCPGPVKTGFGDIASRSEEKRFESDMYKELDVPAEQVVRESIHALLNNRARIYPSWKVALLAAGISILPIIAIRSFNSLRFRKSTTLDNTNE